MSKPHTVIGIFSNSTDNDSVDLGLKWYLSTEDINFMFFNDLTNNKIISQPGSETLKPLDLGKYQVKVVIDRDLAKLFLDGALYYQVTI